MDLLQQAYEIAKSADVQTEPDSVVLYSVSYQKSKINKEKALAYLKEHPQCKTLDDTPCGKLLIALGLETNFKAPQDELMKIWAIASERFILSASGNVTAFADNADPRSTFVATELPNILKNEKILTVNHQNKFVFSDSINSGKQ